MNILIISTTYTSDTKMLFGLPFGHAELSFIMQTIMVVLMLTLIFMTVRNYKIAKLLIRDKTIMFVEIETEEDYKKIMANKQKRFKLIDTDIPNKEKQ